MRLENLNCWIITEGMIGTQNQCVGVAEALGVSPIIKQISLNQPWKMLSPWLGFEMSCTFSPQLDAPLPDLLIAAGRKSIAAARYIKKQSGGKTFVVQLQDPKVSSKSFDLVAAPFHDQVKGKNVIVTDGAPNHITLEKLKEAKQKFAPLFSDIPAPRVAVLIGGNSRTHKLTTAIMKSLVDQLNNLEASLMITTSRRTGDDNLKLLRNGLNNKNAFIWDGSGENPYHGMLAWADHILVTADSVSMLSDAGTTGKPVHMIEMEGGSSRFDLFHHHMTEIGVMRRFDGNLDLWTYEPLADARKIADVIRQAMQKRYG